MEQPSIITVLQQQRNTALDVAANAQADVLELQKQLAALRAELAAKQAPGSPA